ncbi:MAG: hypothetical protein HQK50_11835 [Oligoflexia bacterium]|nr:hypothetical protein [Oligoflexia bacterium]MBF0366254.1 hypothetical protein [Oligoflexia bacterium]
MEKELLTEKFWNICQEVAQKLGLILYDLEYKGQRPPTLRIFILNEQTDAATLDECSSFDHELTPIFEASDFVDEGMVLEVSSPGIYRVLKTRFHYDRALGKIVKLKIKKGNTLRGVLQSTSEQGIVIKSGGQEWSATYEEIAKGNLDPDLKF